MSGIVDKVALKNGKLWGAEYGLKMISSNNACEQEHADRTVRSQLLRFLNRL